MDLKEYNDKFKTDFLASVRAYYTALAGKGHIIIEYNNGKRYLCRYNATTSEFIKLSEIGAGVYMEIIVDNPYSVKYDQSEILSILLDCLPICTASEVNDFFKYEKIQSRKQDKKEMEEDLKNYLSLTAKLATEPPLDLYANAQAQAQVLMANDVFYTGRQGNKLSEMNKYYRWNGKDFVKISANGLQKILCNYFAVTSKEIPINDVQKNERKVYSEILVETSFPITYNQYLQDIKQMKQYKKGHSKISKIFAKFK